MFKFWMGTLRDDEPETPSGQDPTPTPTPAQASRAVTHEDLDGLRNDVKESVRRLEKAIKRTRREQPAAPTPQPAAPAPGAPPPRQSSFLGSLGSVLPRKVKK